MSNLKWILPAIIVISGFLVSTTASYGKAEYVKLTKKGCAYLPPRRQGQAERTDRSGQVLQRAQQLSGRLQEVAAEGSGVWNMHAVQLVIADPVYAAALRDALTRSGPWQVTSLPVPDLHQRCVLVLDEDAFGSLPLPLAFPERIVLITRKDPPHLSQAWEAGIMSVVSMDDAPSTVLLAIMAAALRVPKAQGVLLVSGISPSGPSSPASISPEASPLSVKRSKTP